MPLLSSCLHGGNSDPNVELRGQLRRPRRRNFAYRAGGEAAGTIRKYGFRRDMPFLTYPCEPGDVVRGAFVAPSPRHPIARMFIILRLPYSCCPSRAFMPASRSASSINTESSRSFSPCAAAIL